jgi:hypothetical protein
MLHDWPAEAALLADPDQRASSWPEMEGDSLIFIKDRRDRHGLLRARRGVLAELALAALALPLLGRARAAGAQTYYDQYGQPVTIAPGSVVTPAAPAAAAPLPPGSAAYGPAGVVGQTRRVARRSSRRTGRREDVREDVRDEIDD